MSEHEVLRLNILDLAKYGQSHSRILMEHQALITEELRAAPECSCFIVSPPPRGGGCGEARGGGLGGRELRAAPECSCFIVFPPRHTTWGQPCCDLSHTRELRSLTSVDAFDASCVFGPDPCSLVCGAPLGETVDSSDAREAMIDMARVEAFCGNGHLCRICLPPLIIGRIWIWALLMPTVEPVAR